jgi:sensor histidine kinase YesM
MIRKIATKLMLTYGTLFALMLIISGVLLYVRVSELITERVDSDLSSTADFIKTIVELRIENRRDEVRKDLIAAEHLMGMDFSVSPEDSTAIVVVDYLTELARPVKLPDMRINGSPVLFNYSLVDHIRNRTGSEVTLYQRVPEGLVAVATTVRKENGDRDIGRLVPSGSPWDILVRRYGTFYGRDYFSGEWYFTAWKQITDNDGRDIGAVFVAQRQVDLALLEKELGVIRVGHQGFPFVLDTLSSVIIHPDLKGISWSQTPAFVEMVFRKNGRIEYQAEEPDGKLRTHIAFFRFIPDMNWVLVVGSYKDDFYGGLATLRNIMLVVFGAAALISLFISLILGRRISRPIVDVSEKLAEIAQGEANLEARLNVPSDDEVGRLAGYYNTFVAKLGDLQEMERRGVKVRLKDSEMNALQAQINPHFLHNTLETIRYMIKLGDERAPEMIRLLAELFRISLGSESNIVTIRRELEHIDLYMALQSLRHSGRFRLVKEIDSDILEMYTVKFILQPIVENCIHHGFEPREDTGTVKISGIRDGERISIIISDDGVGMDDKTLEDIRLRLSGGASGGHIGLKNVHDRIQLHFGESYGLRVDHAPGGGTRVVLDLPALDWEPRSFHAWDDMKYAFFEKE